MKQQYISSCGKFIAAKQTTVPGLNVPINRLLYQVKRRKEDGIFEYLGYIFLDPEDNRFKYSTAALAILTSFDCLDMSTLICKIRQAYKHEQRKKD